jgi:cobalamin biosynthesis Mg chelatase CobN
LRLGFLAIGAAAAALVLSTVPAARAACAPTTPPDAAVAQYVEQVPTSCGSHSPNQVAHKTTLSKKVKKKVQKAGKKASALETIATDSTYGAPQQTLPSHSATQPATTTTSTPPATTRPAAVAPKPHKRPHHRSHVQPVKKQAPAVKKPTVPTVHVTVAAAPSGVQSGRVIGLLVVLFLATAAVFTISRRRRTPRTLAG